MINMLTVKIAVLDFEHPSECAANTHGHVTLEQHATEPRAALQVGLILRRHSLTLNLFVFCLLPERSKRSKKRENRSTWRKRPGGDELKKIPSTKTRNSGPNRDLNPLSPHC